MTRDELIQRGQAAEYLLKNPTYMTAVNAVEKALSEDWRATQLENKDGRERLYLMIQMNARILAMLASWASEAQVEIHNADTKKSQLRNDVNV